MGLFDWFKSAERSVSGGGIRDKTELLEQEALCLVDEGNLIEESGRLTEAMQCYEAALEMMPNLARGHLNRGNILLETGRPDEAIKAYATALVHKPDYAAAHFNMGNACFRSNQHGAALVSYNRAIALKPDFVDAYVALGRSLEDLGQFDAAAASYRQALVLRADYVEVHSNLGNVLQYLGRFDDAVQSFRHAIMLDAGYADAHNNLGNALKDLGQFDAAAVSYRRVLELKPDYPEAYSNLLFSHNYQASQAPAQLLSDAHGYGDLVARQARVSISWPNSPDPMRCLRVGLVSGDLRNHPVGYFVESVLTSLAATASERVALYAYSGHFQNDAISERIKACCCSWQSTAGFDDASLAQRIRDDGIDILIDLAGHTAHNRLPVFAWKPAPVQVSWLGYFATTGVAAIDYLIADPITLPETEEKNFTETIWHLPETRLCFTPPDEKVDVGSLPALDNNHITFGCFNTLTKMNDAVVALWARVLMAVPDSRLFLKAKQLTEFSVRQSVVDRFATHGIDSTRLILEGPVSRSAYLGAYHRVDIALDPFPFPGGTTTAESLWMGVPVLTLTGERFLSRQGVGLLMNAGLSEWVALDADDYVARAALHAGDLQTLSSLRKKLRQQVLASPIFDAPRFANYLETALRSMWEKWCAQS